MVLRVPPKFHIFFCVLSRNAWDILLYYIAKAQLKSLLLISLHLGLARLDSDRADSWHFKSGLDDAEALVRG